MFAKQSGHSPWPSCILSINKSRTSAVVKYYGFNDFTGTVKKIKLFNWMRGLLTQSVQWSGFSSKPNRFGILLATNVPSLNWKEACNLTVNSHFFFFSLMIIWIFKFIHYNLLHSFFQCKHYNTMNGWSKRGEIHFSHVFILSHRTIQLKRTKRPLNSGMKCIFCFILKIILSHHSSCQSNRIEWNFFPLYFIFKF